MCGGNAAFKAFLIEALEAHIDRFPSFLAHRERITTCPTIMISICGSAALAATRRRSERALRVPAVRVDERARPDIALRVPALVAAMVLAGSSARVRPGPAAPPAGWW